MADNPRYPHNCVIYRVAGATSFSPEGETVVVYRGACRKSSSSNIRTFDTGSGSTGKVDAADYRISIPGLVGGIQKGDLVDFEGLVGGERGMRVVSFGASTMAYGTELLCKMASN